MKRLLSPLQRWPLSIPRLTSSNVASLLPRVSHPLRSHSKCLHGPLLYVVLWPPLAHLLSYNIVLLGSVFIHEVSMSPSPHLFIYKQLQKAKLSKIEYSNQPWLIRNITQIFLENSIFLFSTLSLGLISLFIV